MAINPIGSAGIFSVLRQINVQSAQIVRSAERISSGLRINRAADDPSGISRVGRFLSQIGGLNAAATNTQTGISMVQSGEGGLSQIQDLVADIKNQAIAAQNASLSSSEIQAIQAQVTQDQAAITDIESTTKFNTQLLLQGTLAQRTRTFQTGPDAGQTVTVIFPDVPTILTDLGTKATAFVGVASPTSATISGPALDLATSGDTAFGDVSIEVGKFGATQNRLQHTLNTLNAMSDATNGALSIIRDADIAAETVVLARAQLRQQTGIAILAQFNTQAQQVLKLLA